jgi:hypothetical protein
MNRTWNDLTDDGNAITLSTKLSKIGFSRTNGKIHTLAYRDGGDWVELLSPNHFAGDSLDLPVVRVEIVSADSVQEISGTTRTIIIEVDRESDDWRIEIRYECYPSGYLVADFVVIARREGASPIPLTIGVPLSDETVLSHDYRLVNLVNDRTDRLTPRALGVDFSIDDRPVTGSVNLLLEQVNRGMTGKPPVKEFLEGDGHHLLCWQLGESSVETIPAGYRYANRWGLSVTSLNNEPNPVRGQRIYHWYGRFPRYPSDDLLVEMAEYGCSIFILHMPVFSFISGSVPADEEEMARVVSKARGLGMKVLFYCVPQLVSRDAPYHEEFTSCRTENIRVWHSLKETQIVFYEEDTTFDADELCLRCSSAYDFIYTSVLNFVKQHSFDGIYIDYAWPAAGLCSDPTHDHDPGCYNFYDYWRILREWRKALGDDALMIGHGGGLLVSSDMVEGFDACLTGEAQKHLDPVGVGQQIGAAPTLWAMHRRKQDVFRSARTVTELVREGMTPHVGLGVLGTSVIASLDPSHHRELLPLWQMWRSFPVERARVLTYMQPGNITLDNDEVAYSLYITDDPYIMLIVSNAGGPYHDANPSVGVRVQIDCAALDLPGRMRTWRMKGVTYETFRIDEVEATVDGVLEVPELLLYETVGFILSPTDPPEELISCIDHLEGRWDRLGELGNARMKRIRELDTDLDRWSKLPTAKNATDYDAFMNNRLTE